MPASLWEHLRGREMSVARGNVQKSFGWLYASSTSSSSSSSFYLRPSISFLRPSSVFCFLRPPLFEKLRKISSMTRSLRYPTHLVANGKQRRRQRKTDVGWEYKRQTSSRVVRECFNLGGNPGRGKKHFLFNGEDRESREQGSSGEAESLSDFRRPNSSLRFRLSDVHGN